MNRYCLDTPAYIEFLRGNPDAVTAIDGASWIGFPTIALGELYTGFSAIRRDEREATRLNEFLAHPVVETIPVDDTIALEYGHLVSDLRRTGIPLPTNDIWIAACAARTSSVVLTCDAVFACIARVGCVVLRAGPLTRPPLKAVE